MTDAWEIHSADEFERSFRRLRKRYPEGADALLARLQNFMDRWLNNPQIAAGFHLPGWVHSEGRGGSGRGPMNEKQSGGSPALPLAGSSDPTSLGTLRWR